MSILDFLKNVTHRIGSLFVKIFGSKPVADFAHAAEQLLATDFGKIVVSIVTSLEAFAAANGGLAGRAAAFKAIAAAAIAAGHDLPESMIHLLIELAVQRLKGTLAALTPSPAAVQAAGADQAAIDAAAEAALEAAKIGAATKAPAADPATPSTPASTGTGG